MPPKTASSLTVFRWCPKGRNNVTAHTFQIILGGASLNITADNAFASTVKLKLFRIETEFVFYLLFLFFLLLLLFFFLLPPPSLSLSHTHTHTHTHAHTHTLMCCITGTWVCNWMQWTGSLRECCTSCGRPLAVSTEQSPRGRSLPALVDSGIAHLEQRWLKKNKK